MIEMSDEEYGRSGVLALVAFVLGVPFGAARRRKTAVAWALTIPLALAYEAFAVPLVVGSVLVVVVLTSPMLLIAAIANLASRPSAAAPDDAVRVGPYVSAVTAP